MSETLLPPNATPQERALEGAGARVSDVPILVREYSNPDLCPVQLLPWLASQFSVDAWKTDWTEDQKRRTIKESVSVHRKKGTVGAVTSALLAFGIGARVQEWFRQTPKGAPYTYKLLLEVSQIGVSKQQMESVQLLVDSTKNLRSHLDTVNLTVTSVAGPQVAAVAGMGTEIRIVRHAPDFYLLMEGAENGMPATEAAVDALRTMLFETMPSNNYW